MPDFMEVLLSTYFQHLTEQQTLQYAALYELYREWNTRINVISRKDIDNLYEKHVLHSLSIAKFLSFTSQSQILDVGTGGGFPGIPLAIFFPEVKFHLIDSIGKKIKVATEVADAIGLENVELSHKRVEEEKRQYDFVVSRAVMALPALEKLTRKNIARKQQNALPNGLICLKGGDLQSEIAPYKKRVEVFPLKDYFSGDFFAMKKLVYLPL